MFHPSEVEHGATTKTMLDELEKRDPQRLVLDSLSEPPLHDRHGILGGTTQRLVTGEVEDAPRDRVNAR
jgi:hypothetical protein